MALTEHGHIAMKRQVHAIMATKEGRDWGRGLLEEIGKGEKGNVGGRINDMAEVVVEVLRELYSAEKPVQSR